MKLLFHSLCKNRQWWRTPADFWQELRANVFHAFDEQIAACGLQTVS